MRILFTGGGAVNEAAYRLWREQYDTHFMDANLDAFFSGLPRDRCLVGPLGNDAVFASAAALCRKLKADLLVPAVDEELPHVKDVATLAGRTA